MTSYNRQAYIAEAIESVLALDYSHFELIIVDDCSSDRSMAIAADFGKRDQRIRIVQNEDNIGDYKNRNRAAALASGKYLKFVDSDDKIFPNGLCEMVSLMEQHPCAGVGLCSPPNHPKIASPVLLDSRSAYLMHYFRQPVFFASPGLAIFRTDIFRMVGGFPEKRMVGDFEMWHKLSSQTPVLLIPGNLYWIRTHSGQEVADQKKYLLEYEKIKIKYLFAAGSPLSQKEANQIIKERKITLLKIAIHKLVLMQWTEAWIRVKTYFFYIRNFYRLRTHFRRSNDE